MRDVLGLIAIGVMLFCAYGFLATFEPPGAVAFRIAYGSVFLACLMYVTWVVRQKLRKR